MGLDATVYCNCFETGKLKEPAPDPALVYVLDCGRLDCRGKNLDVLVAFDKWLRDCACKHKDGILVHHYIGNIALVALLREELGKATDRFPVLIEKVLYSGTHTGDWLDSDEILSLRGELKLLTMLYCFDADRRMHIEQFCNQMQKLVKAALSVSKPIAF